MSSTKPYIMVIEKSSAASELLVKFCGALGIDSDNIQTHSNATRAYASRPVSAIFFNPTMNLIDPRALLEELGGIATQAGGRLSPVIFTVKNKGDLVRAGLKGMPGTAAMEIPLNLEKLFTLFEKLKLTGQDAPEEEHSVRSTIDTWRQYTDASTAWVEKLTSQLGGQR